MKPVSSILILSASHLWRNPRVLKEASALGLAGYEVTVMSVSSDLPSERIDLELIRGLPFKRVVIDYASPATRRRLAHLYQRSMTFAARRVCSLFGIESARALGPTSALLRLARSHPADLTIVHTEIPAWAAQHLIREGRRVAIDMEDWYSEDLLTADRRGRPVELLRRVESQVLNQAEFSFAPSRSMAEALARAYGCPAPIALRNVFPLQAQSRVNRPPADIPTFAWFSQTVGLGRGLEQFLDAWTLTHRRSQVVLIGHSDETYRKALIQRVAPGRREHVLFQPPVNPDALPFNLARFDIGLALEKRTPPSRDLTITNKILQYMNAGLAIVATDTAGQREVMQAAPACGILVTNPAPAAFAQQIDLLLDQPETLRGMQTVSRQAAEREFCWEREVPKLLQAVEGALAHRQRRP